MRGKTFTLITPVNAESLKELYLHLFKEAWRDIEDALKKTRPRFKYVKEAMTWTRRR
jgi:hypothetical protein